MPLLHSPTPWTQLEVYPGQIAISDANGRDIGVIDSGAFAEADAALILAAGPLVAAVRINDWFSASNIVRTLDALAGGAL